MTGQTIAEAQGAVRALLDRTLAGSGLTSNEYVALRVADARRVDDLAGFLAGQRQLNLDQVAAGALVTGLQRRGLLCEGAITPAGMELFERVNARVAATTAQLYEALNEDDLATTQRVLTEVINRAQTISAGS
ncbi:MarR family winged helix-turn-helix transcriptional regulator [Actinoplanes sp. NPDC051513]|uniref:MarR family winged helix-turn-helix transcriptional regulator n=1 Tax=Actinoplanes sp. NPDC051513 TaxID=3363908 RepID=UPI0037932A31